MRKSFLFLLPIILFSCSFSTKTKLENNIILKEKAKKSLGDNYLIIPNKSNTFAIVYNKYKKFNDLFPSIHFFVFDQKTNSIVLEDDLFQGNITWKSDSVLFILSHIKGNKKSVNKFYFDVLKKEKFIK